MLGHAFPFALGVPGVAGVALQLFDLVQEINVLTVFHR